MFYSFLESWLWVNGACKFLPRYKWSLVTDYLLNREVFVKGAIGVIYSIIRWPHKIFSKMILIVSAVAFIPNTLMWCLNPSSIAHFIGKSKIINKNMDELAEITYRKKVRIANTIDRIHTTKDMQKHSCWSPSHLVNFYFDSI